MTAEFGIVLPQKVTCLRREIGAYLEDLPGYANLCVGDLLAHLAPLQISPKVIRRQPTWKTFALARADVTKSGFLWEFNEIFWH